MKRVLAIADPILAGHLHAVLEGAGVPCLLRNNFLGGAAGELPVNECWPEIWVLEDRDLERARRILDDHAGAQAHGPNGWRCSGCGEELEPQFAECWKCGQQRAQQRIER